MNSIKFKVGQKVIIIADTLKLYLFFEWAGIQAEIPEEFESRLLGARATILDHKTVIINRESKNIYYVEVRFGKLNRDYFKFPIDEVLLSYEN